MRRLRVQYQYPIRVTEFRRVNRTGALGLSAIDVEIREVSPGDMRPVAVVANHAQFVDGESVENRYHWTEERGPSLLATFEGAFWLESGSVDDLARTLAGQKDAKGSPFEEDRHWHATEAYTTLARLQLKHPRCRDPYDGNEEVARRLRDRAGKILVVGDRVFERVREPSFRVSWSGEVPVISIAGFNSRSTYARDQLDGPFKDKARHPIGCRRDRLTRLDALRERLADAGFDEPEMACSVEIVDPTAFHDSPLLERVGYLARALWDGIGKSISELSEEQMALVIDLRDALRRGGSGVTPAVRSALTELAGWNGHSGAELYRARHRSRDVAVSFERAVDWARECLAALAAEEPGFDLDEGLLDDASFRTADGIRVQEVRSPGVVAELSVATGVPFEQLRACIEAGGRVYAMDDRTPSETFDWNPMADAYRHQGCVAMDANGQIVLQRMAVGGAVDAARVEAAIAIVAAETSVTRAPEAMTP